MWIFFLQHMQLLPQIKIDIHKLHAREILKRIIMNSPQKLTILIVL